MDMLKDTKGAIYARVLTRGHTAPEGHFRTDWEPY